MFPKLEDTLVVPPTNDLEHRPLPTEPASVEGYVKHVVCEGSRNHVPSYAGYRGGHLGFFSITWCSHRNCIMNHHANETLRANGMDDLCR